MSKHPAPDQADAAPAAPLPPPAQPPGAAGAGADRAALEVFSPATRAWFTGAFAAPTRAQAEAWAAIASGRHTLVVAPTGSGKTLAAFLHALDRLAFPQPAPPPRGGQPCAGAHDPPDAAARTGGRRPAGKRKPARGSRVLYVSPLKALAVDVERNLRSPLAGIRQAAERMGLPTPQVSTGIRSGDTPPQERRRLAAHPPDILITTPESLYLLLTSQARSSLTDVETVILDEVHAVAGTKRGSHLALSLERLDRLTGRPAQRVGLSATVRPAEEVAAFLGGGAPVTVVAPPAGKVVDLSVIVPVEDMGDLGSAPLPSGGGGSAEPARGPRPDDGTDALAAELGGPARPSIWPHVEARVSGLIDRHRSTIVFANSRRLAERLCTRLNELHSDGEAAAAPAASATPAEVMAAAGASAGTPAVVARAHHGSVSKERRAAIEEELKGGRLPAVVATSSLELGIDMGAVDLVVQVESPPSVAAGLQRVGRAGHQVGAVSRGVVFPKHRGDLVQTAVVAERMRAGLIEELRMPRNPLDVLAQQIVAMVAMDDWDVEELLDVVRRAAPFSALPRSAFLSVLDMLAGRYPSDEFASLRPRLVWDRVAGTLTGRPGSQRLAVTSGGTIPDRGLFGVFLAGGGGDGRRGGARVGELDEEMVYESRVGDVFTLGSSSWRIEDISHDRVLVTPAPGQPGKLPFWHGDALGRPAELGRALGAFVRETCGDPDAALPRLRDAGLDEWAVGNLRSYLDEQRAATGHVPDDHTIVVERYRDELGDWRIVVHSPFGGRVNAPWALALGARLRERYGLDAQAFHADDGIIIRLPDVLDAAESPWDLSTLSPSPEARRPGDGGTPLGAEDVIFDPDEVEAAVTAEVGGSALFAARFRECAARALLLPRRRPGARTPLWQQRQRSAQLLAVASGYGSFPIVLETVRECLRDVYDLPGLVELMRAVAARRVRLVEVETTTPSPFARSLMFGYIAAFMYEGDSPLAERRAQALTLDSSLLAELLGQAELRELLDPGAIAAVEAELQWLTDERRVRDAEAAADLLRVVGPLTAAEAERRGAVEPWLRELVASRRAIVVRVAGEERYAAIEDAGRLRDALGAPLPVGVPEAFTEPVPDPLGDVFARYARTHGPFTASEAAGSMGLGAAVASATLERLAASGRVARGEFRPGGAGTEWCDAEVLRRLRRRSLARLRKEIEPVEPVALARFTPAWQQLDGRGGERLRGVDGVLRAVEQLAGAEVPASALESLVLPARVTDYSPAMLDELCSAGEVVWAGRGGLAGGDGWLALYPADLATALLPASDLGALSSPTHAAVVRALGGGGAMFFRDLAARVDADVRDGAAYGGRDGDGRSGGPDGPSGHADPAGRGAPPVGTGPLEVLAALWDLVWAGIVTNDTLAPIRAGLAERGRTSRAPQPSRAPRTRYAGRSRRPGRPDRALLAGGAASEASWPSPPRAAGRWSLVPPREPDATRRAVAWSETLLDRYGIVTRGAVAAEGIAGGFSAVYRVLAGFEESGRARRGYFVEGLGAAQFSVPGAVDRLRDGARPRPGAESTPPADALVLAAADPANPYGAALPWPSRPADVAGGHRPGRKAGAVIVLLGGLPVLYVERGGRSILTWTEEPEALQTAATALAAAVRRGHMGTLTIERANGDALRESALDTALRSAGFLPTPRGFKLRG